MGRDTVQDIVESLGAISTWPEASAELLIAVRRRDGRNGNVAQALSVFADENLPVPVQWIRSLARSKH